MEGAQFLKQRRIDLRRRLFRAIDPGEHLLVRDLQPAFNFGEVGIVQPGQFGVGKAAENQIHLANAAVPEPEFEPAPARVQPIA